MNTITIRKQPEYTGKSTLALIINDGEELTYCRMGCTGDKRRPWFKFHGYEPRQLQDLPDSDKQAILDTLHRCSASLSISL